MSKNEWYRTLGRILKAAKMHPCQLITQWHTIEDYCEKRRADGGSPYAVAAELWPEQV